MKHTRSHLGYKKQREVIQGILTDYNGFKLDISNKKTAGKSQNTWETNHTLLNNTWIKKEISGRNF